MVYHGWIAITSIIAIIATAHYITDSLSTFPDHYESSPTCELQRHILDVSRIFETRGVADDTRSTSVSLPPSSDTKNTAVIIAGSSAARLKATDGKKEIFETTSIKFQRIPACRKSVLWPRLRLLKVIVYRYTIIMQLARLMLELGRWAIIQTSSILGCWDIAIFNFCILFNLRRRRCFLWAGLSKLFFCTAEAAPCSTS